MMAETPAAPAIEVRVQRLRCGDPPLPLPAYQTAGAAGLDLVADLIEPIRLAPGERSAVPTGLAVEIPTGYEGQVRPRSGLALRHGLTLLNSPGTIDADYRGEIQVLMINLGQEAVEIRRGERIAQLIVAPVCRATLREVETLATTPRGAGGFGHTGR